MSLAGAHRRHGGRKVLPWNGQDELEEIYKAIGALQKQEFGVRQFTDYQDRFQVFLLPRPSPAPRRAADIRKGDPLACAVESAAT